MKFEVADADRHYDRTIFTGITFTIGKCYLPIPGKLPHNLYILQQKQGYDSMKRFPEMKKAMMNIQNLNHKDYVLRKFLKLLI